MSQFKALLEKAETVGKDEPQEGSGKVDGEPASLLVVADGDEEYRTMAVKALRCGYTVVEAGDCEKAVSLLSEREREIAAIILSIEMAEMNNGSMLRALDKGRDFWHIPVVVTGPADRDLELKALLMGADDYVGKPCSPELLLQRVKRVVVAAQNERTVKQLQEPFSEA